MRRSLTLLQLNDLHGYVRPNEVAFITEQGVPARFGRDRTSTGVDAVAALRKLFEARGPVVPPSDPSVFVV